MGAWETCVGRGRGSSTGLVVSEAWGSCFPTGGGQEQQEAKFLGSILSLTLKTGFILIGGWVFGGVGGGRIQLKNTFANHRLETRSGESPTQT